MRTEAQVTSVTGEIAIVETMRMSACEGCHKAEDGGCSVCSLVGGSRKLSAKAYNRIGARVGDRVVIESATGRMLWYAALVFLVPLLVPFACWGIALLFGADETAQLWSAVGGFLASLAGIFVYSRTVQSKRCDVEITEILGPKTDIQG